MAAAITKAGESLIAQKQAGGEVLEVVRFVLAQVPGLDPNSPVDRDGLQPPAEQIVYTQDCTQKGYVNPNQVVYSLMMGSDVGDFDWNWIGLETAEGVLLSVAYVPVQQKRKTILPNQIGNNVTRNFLVVFDGAQALTAITVDASTWQHDFTVRLNGIDTRERVANRDVYGRACFFGAAFQLESTGGSVQLTPGIAYIEGLRVRLAASQVLTPAVGKVWLDVCLQRQRNDRVVTWSVVFGEQADYIDAAGEMHFCVPLADFSAIDQITDLRTVEPVFGPLMQHFANRVGTYPQLRAQATTKADVGLGNLPNAKSDDPASNSSEILATTAALNHLNQQISDSLVGMVAAFDMASAPPGWLKRNGANVSRTAYAKLFAVIGTRYGAGDGSTTFNVGDSRGLFTRGLDDGRGVDPNRDLGSIQAPANLHHTHGGVADSAGGHAHYSAAGSGGSVTVNYGSEINVAPTGNTTTGAAGVHQHTLTIYGDGDTESRPINEALLVCIKY